MRRWQWKWRSNVNRLKKNKTKLQSEEEKENQNVVVPDMQEFIMEKYDEKAKKIKVKDPEKNKKVLRIIKKCIICRAEFWDF